MFRTISIALLCMMFASAPALATSSGNDGNGGYNDSEPDGNGGNGGGNDGEKNDGGNDGGNDGYPGNDGGQGGGNDGGQGGSEGKSEVDNSTPEAAIDPDNPLNGGNCMRSVNECPMVPSGSMKGLCVFFPWIEGCYVTVPQ